MNRSMQRNLTINEKLSLKKKYESLLKSGHGILTTFQRKRIVGISKEGRSGTKDSDVWYRAKMNSRNGLMDLLLICDYANEKTIKEIFYDVDERINNYPLTALIKAIFPPSVKQISEEEKWRVRVLEEIVCRGLEWYLQRGVFPTESHQRLIFETLDAITITSSRRKIYEKTTEGGYLKKVDFEGIPMSEEEQKKLKELNTK